MKVLDTVLVLAAVLLCIGLFWVRVPKQDEEIAVPPLAFYDEEGSIYVIPPEPQQQLSTLEMPDDSISDMEIRKYFNSDVIREELDITARATTDLFMGMEQLQTYEGTIYIPTPAERRQITNRIAELGFAVSMNGMDMRNTDQVLDFIASVTSGETDDMGIYVVDHTITRETFHTEDGEVFGTALVLAWDTQGNAMIPLITYGERFELFRLTEKGYLFYGQNRPSGKISYKTGLRVSPLGSENYSLLKYLEPLHSYKGHNILISNWNRDSLNTLNFNDVFHALYLHEYDRQADIDFPQLYSNDNFQTKAIPGDVFEMVIGKYFPVSAEELRRYAVYDAERHVYAFESELTPDNYPIFEVVSKTENSDGSFTLEIDAVFLQHAEDRVATNLLTIMPTEDGFQYIGNEFALNPDAAVIMHNYQPRVSKENQK